MVANNLANSGTGGFKLDREFYSLFSAGKAEPSKATPIPRSPSSRNSGPISARARFSPRAILWIWRLSAKDSSW